MSTAMKVAVYSPVPSNIKAVHPQGFKTVDLEMAKSCPKYNWCSAPYCPILGGRHFKRERVCHYLREWVKPGGQARAQASLPESLAEVVALDTVRLMSSTGPPSKAAASRITPGIEDDPDATRSSEGPVFS